MGECAGCRHWDKATSPLAAGTGSGESFKVVDVPGEWGTCERIIRRGESSHNVPPMMDAYDGNVDEHAFLSDGSGYFASLTTRSDFGCSLWEAPA